jgi:5,6,7,8-tetrahydromethanopterin hydro-lyase
MIRVRSESVQVSDQHGTALPQATFNQRRLRHRLQPIGPPSIASTTEKDAMASNILMNIGEALAGEGNEIAHIDLLIGDKTGPVGVAFANALANQSAGHSNLLAVLTPNLIAKPATVLITKVTIKGMTQAVQMFGPAQYAVAKAVADSVAVGIIPASAADDLVIVCGVFIHPDAKDNAKILKYNYDATKLAIERAMKNLPTTSEITAQKDTVKHPFAG